MRLLYLNKIHTNAGWGAETFLNAALLELGVETICVDYEQNKYRLAHSLLALDKDFDAVLLQRGRGYLFSPQIMRAIHRPRFFLFTELVSRNWLQHYLLRNHLFDHVFLRSSACIQQVVQKGWLNPNQVSLMLSTVRPDFFRPLENVGKDIDVLFVGSVTPRRHAILNELSKDFSITVKSAFGEEMVELLNRAKIILNVHAEAPLDTEMRVYEVLACKGFLVTEKLSTESPFIHGTHLVESSSLEELKHNIRYYLDHPELRHHIAECGYRHVLSSHTVDVQAKQLVATIGNYLPTTRPAVQPFDQALLRRAHTEEQARKLMQPMTTFLFKMLGKGKRTLRARIFGRET